jgi:16S rRNA (guanine(527)-N(7))-methyltransferase RsmG
MTEPTDTDSEEQLRAGLQGHGLGDAVVDAFAAHFRLLRRWNPTHNLTRVVDAADAAVLHYLDCALPLLQVEAPGRLLDIGSGAGFPGLIAAILWRDTTVGLVEPARKRASFLRVAAGELGLANVQVSDPGRAAGSAEMVLSRATFSAGARAELWGYVAAGGRLLAWTTAHDRSMWETEAATWSPASLTWHPYALPTPAGAETRSHGLLHVSRAAFADPNA